MIGPNFLRKEGDLFVAHNGTEVTVDDFVESMSIHPLYDDQHALAKIHYILALQAAKEHAMEMRRIFLHSRAEICKKFP